MKALKLMWMLCMHSFYSGFYRKSAKQGEALYHRLGVTVVEKDLLEELETKEHDLFWVIVLYSEVVLAAIYYTIAGVLLRIVEWKHFKN